MMSQSIPSQRGQTVINPSGLNAVWQALHFALAGIRLISNLAFCRQPFFVTLLNENVRASGTIPDNSPTSTCTTSTIWMRSCPATLAAISAIRMAIPNSCISISVANRFLAVVRPKAYLLFCCLQWRLPGLPDLCFHWLLLRLLPRSFQGDSF